MNKEEILSKLDEAEAALTNLGESSESFDSAISAARCAINSARANLKENS